MERDQIDRAQLKAKIADLRTAIDELDRLVDGAGVLDGWNPANTVGSRRPKDAMRKIMAEARTLDVVVRQNTFSGGT